MFPMILGALAIIGLAIRDPATEVRFQLFVINVFPVSAQGELQHAMEGVKASAGWFGIVSIGGLLWSASSIFSTMEFALTEIFGTRQRDMLRQRLMGLVMMILLVVAIVATVVVNALAGLMDARHGDLKGGGIPDVACLLGQEHLVARELGPVVVAESLIALRSGLARHAKQLREAEVVLP